MRHSARSVLRECLRTSGAHLCGYPHLYGTAYVSNLDELHADFAVLGVPFDEGTWGWLGERYGPRNLRESSQEYSHPLTEGFYYIDGNRTVLKGKRWVGVGDVPIMPTVRSSWQS